MIGFDLKGFFLPCAPQGAPPCCTGMLAQRGTQAGTAAPWAQRRSCRPSCPSFCLFHLCVTLVVVNPSAARCCIFSGPLGSGVLTERAGAARWHPQISIWSELLESCRPIVSSSIRGALFVALFALSIFLPFSWPMCYSGTRLVRCSVFWWHVGSCARCQHFDPWDVIVQMLLSDTKSFPASGDSLL